MDPHDILRPGMPVRIGPYRVLKAVAEGGMGVVYQGMDPMTARRVAIKTVNARQAIAIGGIRREIDALSRLSHPGIIRIVSHGVEAGMPWYAMELLDGTTLRDYISGLFPPRQGAKSANDLTETEPLLGDSVPPRFLDDTAVLEQERPHEPLLPAAGGFLTAVLSLVRRLCAPLAYLHGEGLVHRDLKPDNILVKADGNPVIVDFGLLGFVSLRNSRESLQAGGDVSGTVTYMAPEQATGTLVDARADLYSLGCVLYELVAGRPPFLGPSVKALLYDHAFTPPPPLSSLASDVPRELEELVARLLEKRPENRPGYASDVAAALASLGAADDGECSGKAYLYRPRLAGRSDVLEELSGFLDRLSRGIGGIALVEGESGTGKTRLLTEIATIAKRRGMAVLLGGCEESDRGVPLWSLKGPLQEIADACRERGPEETRRLFGRRCKILSPFVASLALLPGADRYPEAEELSGDAGQVRIVDALVETIVAFSRGRRLLLILDDLQWADEITIAFLTRLTRGDLCTLLVVGGTRNGGPGTAGFEDLNNSEVVPSYRLRRLDERAVGSMVADMLAMHSPPRRFVRFLAAKANGNPLYVAEYLKAAIESGTIYRGLDGIWRVGSGDGEATQDTYESIAIPASVRAIVQQRIDKLSPEAKRLLALASALGRDFNPDLLSSVAKTPESEVVPVVTHLVRGNLLEDRGGTLSFCHDLIRSQAYESLRDKEQAHAAVAQVLEANPAAAPDPGVLARHWERAGDSVKAADNYIRGGDEAERRFAHARAEQLYGRALDLLSRESERRPYVLATLGSVVELQGRLKEAEAHYREALTAARALVDREGELRALSHLGRVLRITGRIEESIATYEKALACARSMGDRAREGGALGDLGIVHERQGDLRKARALYEQALAAARQAGNRKIEISWLGNLGNLDQREGRMDSAGNRYKAAIRIAREEGERRREGIWLGNHAILHAREGRMAEAESLASEALAVAQEVGDKESEGARLANLASLIVERKHYSQARELFLQAIRIARELGDRRALQHRLGNLARLEAMADDPRHARRLAREAIELAREAGDDAEVGALANFIATLPSSEDTPGT